MYQSRPFERSEAFGRVGEQVLDINTATVDRNHIGSHGLAPLFRGRAGHGHVADVRVGEEHILDLTGVDVEPARDDEVLAASDDVQVAVRVEPAEVTRPEPTVT